MSEKIVEKAKAEMAKAAEQGTKKQEATQVASKAPVMYVGPTIAGVAIQNTVYTEIPDGALEAAKELPAIRNLFVPIREYPAAEQMLRTGKGYIASAWKKALAYKNEGGVNK